LTGFDPGELDELFKDSLKDKIKEDDFDVDSELKKPAVSQLGDISPIFVVQIGNP